MRKLYAREIGMSTGQVCQSPWWEACSLYQIRAARLSLLRHRLQALAPLGLSAGVALSQKLIATMDDVPCSESDFAHLSLALSHPLERDSIMPMRFAVTVIYYP